MIAPPPRPVPKRPASARAAFRLACALTGLLTGCQPQVADLPPDVVAQVGPRRITTQEFRRELERRGVTARNEEEAAQRRRDVLTAMVEEESLVQRAFADGLDRDPEIQQRFRKMLVQELRERALGSAAAPKVSEEDLRLWYDAHPEEFTQPARTRGALISLRLPRGASKELNQAASQQLEAARQQIESSANPASAFEECARTLSDDPTTRRQGGDTGWLIQGRLTRWPEEVVAGLFALTTPGSLSPVLHTPGALYLVRLTESEPPRREPFTEVRDRLEHRVAQAMKERREKAFMAEALHRTEVRENPAILASLEIPKTADRLGQVPPRLPADSTSLPLSPR